MTVKEFKEFLNQFPDDMVVAATRFSDFGVMSLEDWNIVEAIPKPNGNYYENNPEYMMRVYEHQKPKMFAEDIANIRKYLHYRGN